MDNVKIAVVDQDPVIRDFIVNVMMYSVNREVLAFENAAGLQAYLTAGGDIDLVMAEINSPDEGEPVLDLLKSVKKDHPSTKIVVLSGSPQDEKAVAHHHFDSFLAKPFGLNDLFAIVQRFVVEGHP